MQIIETERVFLINYLPTDLADYDFVYINIGDITEENTIDIIKVRQKGDYFELIKKEEISKLERKEYIIPLTENEFNIFFQCLVGNIQK